MKTTRPTTILPPTTTSPNASIICPASPSSKICRVLATLIETRNNVVIRRSAGKVLKCMDSLSCITSTISKQEIEIFIAISMSNSHVGNGSIIDMTTAITNIAAMISERLPFRKISPSNTLMMDWDSAPLVGVVIKIKFEI